MTHERLTIQCGPADDRDKRLVLAQCNGYSHRDKFDVNNSFQRSKFRDALIAKFALDESAHEAIEEQLIRAADAEDSLAEQEPLSIPKLLTASEIKPIETRWKWEHRFPEGAIVNISGNAGLGKSQLLTDITARETRGWGMPPGCAPDGTFKPRDVLILSAEDDPARTIVPRLIAAGADLTRVHILRAVTIAGDDEERAVVLPIDVAAIERIIVEKDCGLLLIDPYEGHVADGTNTNSNTDNRKCLTPLARMAERTGATICIVQHLNKNSGMAAIHRAAGSVAIVAAARAAFVVAADPDDPSVRIFACVKSNLGPMPDSLTFTIEQVGATSRVVWTGTSQATADEVLGTRGTGEGKLDLAKGIIVKILCQGPRGENEVRGACDQAGVSFTTYKRARRELGLLSEKVGFGKTGEWMLTLPLEVQEW